LGVDGGCVAHATRDSGHPPLMKLGRCRHVSGLSSWSRVTLFMYAQRQDCSTTGLVPPQLTQTFSPSAKLSWSQRERLGREIRINRPLASRTWKIEISPR